MEDEDENEAMRDMEREERERTGFGGGGGGGGNDWDGFAEGGGSSWPPGVTPVLEELPKWSLLAKVLEEIEEEISVQATVDLSEFRRFVRDDESRLSRADLSFLFGNEQPSLAPTPSSSWLREIEPALNFENTSPLENLFPTTTQRLAER